MAVYFVAYLNLIHEYFIFNPKRFLTSFSTPRSSDAHSDKTSLILFVKKNDVANAPHVYCNLYVSVIGDLDCFFACPVLFPKILRIEGKKRNCPILIQLSVFLAVLAEDTAGDRP